MLHFFILIEPSIRDDTNLSDIQIIDLDKNINIFYSIHILYRTISMLYQTAGILNTGRAKYFKGDGKVILFTVFSN